MKRLFIGKLAWATTDEGLQEFFEQFGTVTSASVVKDRDTGRSRGFGFVEFEDDAEAERAIEEGDGQDLDGRTIAVSESRPRTEGDRPRRDRNDGGGYRGGGYRSR